jgi:hypothetical protein
VRPIDPIAIWAKRHRPALEGNFTPAKKIEWSESVRYLGAWARQLASHEMEVCLMLEDASAEEKGNGHRFHGP